MSSIEMKPQLALVGLEHETGDVRVVEITGRAIASLAIPRNGAAILRQRVADQYQTEMPAVGHSNTSPVTNARLLGLASDQMFLLFDDRESDSVAAITRRFKGAAYITDQSDSWVMFQVSGSNSRAALERICQLDLHHDVFGPGATARTMMEHLGVIIVNEGNGSFLLMSARSSAQSFWIAIIQSVRNIAQPA